MLPLLPDFILMRAFTCGEKSSDFYFPFNKWPEETPAIKIFYRQVTHPQKS